MYKLFRINPTGTTKVCLLVSLSYLPHNIENAFYTTPTQSFAHDGREYLIMRDYDKASTIGGKNIFKEGFSGIFYTFFFKVLYFVPTALNCVAQDRKTG